MDFQIGTHYDPKEEIFRNYPGFIETGLEVSLRHIWKAGPEGSVAFFLISPSGTTISKKNITIRSGNKKAVLLLTPNCPGMWKVGVQSDHLNEKAEVKFLVLPTETTHDISVSDKCLEVFYHNTSGLKSNTRLTDYQKSLGTVNVEELTTSKKIHQDLLSQIDYLTELFWKAEGMCSSEDLGSDCSSLDLCSETRWSSMSPDPKSEIKIDNEGNMIKWIWSSDKL